MSSVSNNKIQPWKTAWPPAEQQQSCPLDNGIEYGVSKGEIAVVDGTAANVKPQATKTQPWKAAWPPATSEQKCDNVPGVEYGVAKGDIAVVDGTAANIKPAKKKDENSA
jgi:hypothetical protein